MGMVVRTNIQAVNANRQLGMNNSQVSKSLEKLASGFRINRAGDDASGLAISEKMKAQIKGLETASANSQDGISLIQTAEGALTEVHDMLNRMVELAGKSANGTMDDDVDRASLQKELESLQVEIDRIAEGTNFNGKMLLNGSLDAGGAVAGGAAGVPKVSFGELDMKENQAVKSATPAIDFIDSGTFADMDISDGTKTLDMTFNYTDAKGNAQSVTISFTGKDDAAGDKLIAADGTEYDVTDISDLATADGKAFGAAIAAELKKTGFGDEFKIADGQDGKLTFTSKTAGANAKIDSFVASDAADAQLLVDTATGATEGIDAFQSFDFGATPTDNDKYTLGDVFEVGGKQFAFVKDEAALKDLDKNVHGLISSAEPPIQADLDKMAALIKQQTGYEPTVNGTTFEFKAPTGAAANTGKGLTLQVGDTADAFNKVTVSIRDMSCAGIGIANIKVSDQDAASEAIKQLKNTSGDNEFGAINIVSSVRADLGALQNKLEHTINNLDVAAENMTSANSRIRDTDMAKEMMSYTKMNVLTQAAQAMLAQANSSTQSVLQLLQ